MISSHFEAKQRSKKPSKKRGYTFQTLKDCGSTTVGCTTSLAGNTPHVTALTWLCATLDLTSPAAFTAMYVSVLRPWRRDCSLEKDSGEQKNSTYAFW